VDLVRATPLARGLLLCAALGAAAPAWADCGDLAVLPGSRGERQLKTAEETAIETFGAAETLSREALPAIPRGGGMGVCFGVESFYNVARVPAHSIGGFIGDCDRTGQDLVRAYPFDVNAVNLAIAVRGRWVGASYSTSALATAVPANGFQRGLITTLNTAGGLYWMVAGPSYGAERSEVRETQTVFLSDCVVGGTVDLKVVQGAAGFVGSRGFCANLRSDRAFLFSDAIFSDGMQRVPMLAGGLGRLPLAGMLSSAYTRRLDIDATPLGERAALARDALWTGHVDQELIAGMFDVKAALAVQPTVDFQEAVLRWHPPRDAEELSDAGLTPDLLPGVWGTPAAPPCSPCPSTTTAPWTSSPTRRTPGTCGCPSPRAGPSTNEADPAPAAGGVGLRPGPALRPGRGLRGRRRRRRGPGRGVHR
jgi:hypothetical protein